MDDKAMYDEVIQFAINNEQEAIDLYTKMANSTQSPSGKVLFNDLADMERGHKTKLEKLNTGYFSAQEIPSCHDSQQIIFKKEQE